MRNKGFNGQNLKKILRKLQFSSSVFLSAKNPYFVINTLKKRRVPGFSLHISVNIEKIYGAISGKLIGTQGGKRLSPLRKEERDKRVIKFSFVNCCAFLCSEENLYLKVLSDSMNV